MPVITSDLSSRLMLALLTALLFIAPSGQANARSRAFQMALWGDESDSTVGINTDIAVFPDGDEQPKGFSIMINYIWQKPVSEHKKYAWSRILAVLVDEPYNDFNGVSCWSSGIVASVNDRSRLLAQRAAELKSVAPLTRFWVNLAQPQLDWMLTVPCVDDGAPVNVNLPYIDVISVDIYYKAFGRRVKRYYDWLDANRAKPDQQLALIPGTFYRQGKDKPRTQASYLQGYFDYANKANHNCNLPLGSRGLTGSFDGCRVWMVMGWLAHNHTEGGFEYVGERDARSKPIADVWRAKLALPLRPDLASPRLGGTP